MGENENDSTIGQIESRIIHLGVFDLQFRQHSQIYQTDNFD